MNNSSISLNNMRQTALMFASLCCAVAALAAAAPVFAAAYPTMVDNSAINHETAAVAPVSVPDRTPAPVPAATPKVDEEAEMLARASLKPGDFVWRENASKIVGAPRLVVNISDQRAILYRADTIVAVTTVSTGRKGHATPTGTFKITEKHAVHFSNKYDNAPMPHMQRLTNDGIALHAGYIPGRPASHGCVRLPAKFAADLFKVTTVGTPVTIIQ